MRLGDLDALRKNMEFICMGIMAGTEPYNAPLTEIDNASTVEITEEQAIDKLHETGWLPEHDRQMTENKGDLISREALKETVELEEGIFWGSYSPDELVIRKKYIDNAPTVEPETKVVANVTFNKEQVEELLEKAKADILAQIERPQQGEFVKILNERIEKSVCKFCQMNKHCELCEISRVFMIIALTDKEMNEGCADMRGDKHETN